MPAGPAGQGDVVALADYPELDDVVEGGVGGIFVVIDGF
jgi:hypothetical protein